MFTLFKCLESSRQTAVRELFIIAYIYPVKLSSNSLKPAIKDPQVMRTTEIIKGLFIYLDPPLKIPTIKTNNIKVLLKAKNLIFNFIYFTLGY